MVLFVVGVLPVLLVELGHRRLSPLTLNVDEERSMLRVTGKLDVDVLAQVTNCSNVTCTSIVRDECINVYDRI